MISSVIRRGLFVPLTLTLGLPSWAAEVDLRPIPAALDCATPSEWQTFGPGLEWAYRMCGLRSETMEVRLGFRNRTAAAASVEFEAMLRRPISCSLRLLQRPVAEGRVELGPDEDRWIGTDRVWTVDLKEYRDVLWLCADLVPERR